MENFRNDFWYAVTKQEYIAILGLLLEQKWFSEPIKSIACLTGYAVMMISIGLMGFVTIVMVRDVAPVIAQPGTWRHSLFHWTLVVGSFNVFFNFISAAVFSLRLGRTPPSKRFYRSTTGDCPKDIEIVSRGHSFSNVCTSRDDLILSSKYYLHRQIDEEEDDSSDTASNKSTKLQLFNKCKAFCSSLHMHLRQFYSSGFAPSLASTEVLRELERMSLAAESYTLEERRYRLLDAPRRRCKTCCRLKAPREHHCSLCNECVPKMDHHCMFLNNCVDVENQRYFVLFVLWLHIMSFFVVNFAGYGWLCQMRYERELKRATQQLFQSLEMDSRAALQKRVLHLTNAPYGPIGAKLISGPVNLSIILVCVAIIFTGIFNVQNFIQIWRNATPIEGINIRHKRKWIFSTTNFWYRSPYNLGPWRNFIEVFRTVDDPIVFWELEKACRMGNIESTSRAEGTPAPPQGYLGLFLHSLQRAAVVAWLMGMPTLRPTGQDGIHYPISDAELQDCRGRGFSQPPVFV